MKIIFAILAFALVAATDELPEVDEKGIKDLIKKMREAINTGEKHLLKINNIPGTEGIVERVDEATDELGHFVYHLKKAQAQCRKVTEADPIRCRRLLRMFYVYYKSKALELIEFIENDALRVIPLPLNSAAQQSEASEPIKTIEDDASTVIPLPSNSTSSKKPHDKLPEVDEKGIKDLIKKMLEAINTGEKHLLKINNIPGAEGIVERVDEATDKLGHFVYHLKKAQRQCRRVTDADLIRCRRLLRMYYVLYKSKALKLIESIENNALFVIPLPTKSAAYQSEAIQTIETIEDDASTVIPLPTN